MTRIVLVLGMHRSGTSVVARGLECLGVTLGDRLMAPASDNPKGFFEDLDLVEIDERVLQQLGAAWDDPPPFCVGTLAAISAGKLGVIARQRLSSKVSPGLPFAFKDPRLCLLLPFWRPVFQDLALDVSCVVVLRNPLSVAASLEQRNAIPQARSMELWLRYMLAAMTEMNWRWPMAFVEYDSVVANPNLELEKIGQTLHLQYDAIKGEAFARTFVDAQMRHERDEGEAPIAYADLVWPSYNLLCDIARGSDQPGEASLEELRGYKARFEAVTREETAGAKKEAARWVPRSGRDEFQGCIWLPRMIDKARRVVAGGNSYLIDDAYMFGENDFVDGRLLRFLEVGSADVLDAVRAEPNDALAAARIIAPSGKTPQECEKFSRCLRLAIAPFLPMIDADEGRRAPGLWTTVLRGFLNGVVAPPALAAFRRAERSRRTQPTGDTPSIP